MILSNTVANTGNTVIGLKFAFSKTLSFLWYGVTCLCFQVPGTCDLVIVVLRSLRGFDIVCDDTLTAHGRMESCPRALLYI